MPVIGDTDGDFNHDDGSGWRPQGAGWDAGAVEYSEQSGSWFLLNMKNEMYNSSRRV